MDRIKEIADLLKELADELEAEVIARWGNPPHPANERRLARDMRVVLIARAEAERLIKEAEAEQQAAKRES